ncbi:Glycogen debranching enzyme [Cronobacter dublinensis 582]|nr:Glycogen debranching enzyme [Cronobacter dublinensis 582]
MTAHDGFTLRDCVSFNEKHNEANGEDNRDGAWENHSSNHGYEGLGGGQSIQDARRARQRACVTGVAAAVAGHADAAGGG